MNPRLTLTVDGNKVSSVGTISVGEKIDVTIVGLDTVDIPEWGAGDPFSGLSLRLRIVDGEGRDVAVFPRAGGEEWTVGDEIISCENMELNTVHLRDRFRGVAFSDKLQFGIILDSAKDDAQYARGKTYIQQWAKARNDDPTVLPNWYDLVREIKDGLAVLDDRCGAAAESAASASASASSASDAKDQAMTSALEANAAKNDAVDIKNGAMRYARDASDSADYAEDFATEAKSAMGTAVAAASAASESADRAEDVLSASVKKSGDTMTGALSVPAVTLNGSDLAGLIDGAESAAKEHADGIVGEESSRAKGEEAVIADNLKEEIESRKLADLALARGISDEKARAEAAEAGLVKRSGDTMTGRLRFDPMTGDEGVVEVRTDSTETVTARDIYEYVRLIALKSVTDKHNVADVDVRYQQNGDIALYNQVTRKVNGNSVFATLAISISNAGSRSLIASGFDSVSLPSGDAVKFNGKSLTEIIAAIKTFSVKVVSALPASGEDRTIYLVPSSSPESGNIKDEYLWVDGKWEKIGTTDVDLSEYLKKTDRAADSAKLGGVEADKYAMKSALATKITNYGSSSDEIRFVSGPDGGNVVFYLRNGSINLVIFSSIGDGKSIIFEWVEDGETKHMYVEDIATKDAVAAAQQTAEAAALSAGNAYTTAMAADSKATTADSKATAAKSIAEDAQASADDAVGYAELAVRTAEAKLDADGTAADSAKLGGVAASEYARKTDVPKRVSNDTDTVRCDGEGNVYEAEFAEGGFFTVKWKNGNSTYESECRYDDYSSGEHFWKSTSPNCYVRYRPSDGRLNFNGWDDVAVTSGLDPLTDGVVIPTDTIPPGGHVIEWSFTPQGKAYSGEPTDRFARESQVEEGLTPLAEGSLDGISDYLLNDCVIVSGVAVLSRDAVNRIDMSGVSSIALQYPTETGRVRDFVVVFDNVSGSPNIDFGTIEIVTDDASVLEVGAGTNVMSFTEISAGRFMVSRRVVEEVA